MRIYKSVNVVDATKKRIEWIFDNYKSIIVSVSGGKDSSVCFHLIHTEAEKRKTKFYCFFLDQEVEYQSSIDIIYDEMTRSKYVIPLWYQIPLKMRNATTINEHSLYLNAWYENERHLWMRKKVNFSIKENKTNVNRFYPFLRWHGKQWDKNSCFVVGLRSEESLYRYRALTKYPAVDNKFWTSKNIGSDAINIYPVYDWTFEDIFKFIYENKIKYNKVYDFMHTKKFSINEMRVSNLIHIQAFKCLTCLHEFEPITYEKLLNRGISGIHTAAIYAKEKTIYNTKTLPKNFSSWKEYRDHLLQTQPEVKKWKKKFYSMNKNEKTYKLQVNVILKNDIDIFLNMNNKSLIQNKIEKWKNIL